MSGLLKNAALEGQMRELSEAVLALCALDSERPVQRKASIQSCLNFDLLSCIDDPRSLDGQNEICNAACDLPYSWCPFLDIRLEVGPVLSKRLDQTSSRGLFQHNCCSITT